MNDLIEEVSAAIDAGQTQEEVVENVRLEQYSHLMEYERSIENNVSVAYTIPSSLRGQ
jgi:hypothetical protein